MQVALLKLTAHRTKAGLETFSREVTPLPEDPDSFLNKLTEVLAEKVLKGCENKCRQ